MTDNIYIIKLIQIASVIHKSIALCRFYFNTIYGCVQSPTSHIIWKYVPLFDIRALAQIYCKIDLLAIPIRLFHEKKNQSCLNHKRIYCLCWPQKDCARKLNIRVQNIDIWGLKKICEADARIFIIRIGWMWPQYIRLLYVFLI